MNTLRQMQAWSVTHHPRWLIVLRVALGFCLFAKGIVFLSNSILLDRLLSASPMETSKAWLAILITWANLLSGFMLVVGLMTRLVCLLQIPILIGAIIFINTQREGFAVGSELGLAFAVLILLVVFLIEGSGPYSLDHYFSANRGQSSGTNL